MKNKISLQLILCLFTLNLIACATPSKTAPDPGSVVAQFPEMSVGDSWIVLDYIRDFGTANYTYEVISVEADGSFDMRIKNDKNNIEYVKYFDSTLIGIPMIMGTQFDPEALQFPLFVGKSWKTVANSKSVKGENHIYKSQYTVEEYTKVETAVGVFDAFRIHQKIRSVGTNWRGSDNHWYAPAAKAIVKSSPTHIRGVKILEMNLVE